MCSTWYLVIVFVKIGATDRGIPQVAFCLPTGFLTATPSGLLAQLWHSSVVMPPINIVGIPLNVCAIFTPFFV